MLKVTRPVSSVPDEYQIALDESALMMVEDAISKQIAAYRESVALHDGCDQGFENGCKYVHPKAPKDYKGPRSCDEDLMFLHEQLSLCNHFLFQARYLRQNNTSLEA